MKKIDHIGIAVRDLESATIVYEKLLHSKPYKKNEIIAEEQVKVSFFDINKTSIELIEATDSQSSIAKYIAKNGEGVHHIAFEVEDIESEITRLQEEGFAIIAPPKKGANNKLIAFLHPKTTHGVLIELCQKMI